MGETIAQNILRAGYYRPTLFQDAHSFVKKCKTCELSAGGEKKH
jgi:hypothetical protein